MCSIEDPHEGIPESQTASPDVSPANTAEEIPTTSTSETTAGSRNDQGVNKMQKLIKRFKGRGQSLRERLRGNAVQDDPTNSTASDDADNNGATAQVIEDATPAETTTSAESKMQRLTNLFTGRGLTFRERLHRSVAEDDVNTNTDAIANVEPWNSGSPACALDVDLPAENTRDEMVQQLIDLIQEKGGAEAEWLRTLTPSSIRDVIKNSLQSLARDDNAAISVKVERVPKRVPRWFRSKVELCPDSSHWLFPFDCRELLDLPRQHFEKLSVEDTKDLPVGERVWVNLLENLFDVEEHRELEINVKDLKNPYKEILLQYRNRRGTIGGLVKGLKDFRDCREVERLCGEDKGVITGYIDKVEHLQAMIYKETLDKLDKYKTLSISSEDFIKYHRQFNLRAKKQITYQLEDLSEDLNPGDMLWMMRKGGALHKSYAHVGIVSVDSKCIHVTANTGLV